MALSPLSPGTGLSPNDVGGFRYRVERELGSGGFGITYEAVHVGLGRRVVIKELACDSVSRRDADSRRVFALTNREYQHQRVMQRFIDEARLLSRLAGENCPHIVRVIDVFEQHGTAYYVMDRIETSGHVPSEPLAGAEGVTRALRLARELLVALDVAHRYTTLHGDIKPANLLLDSQDRLVLIDFGTARSDEDLARTRATTMHTPGYAPPELMSASRLREAGAWSDLYSWGMVVYGLLWRHPWQIEDENGAMVAWPLDVVGRMVAVDDPYGKAAHAQLCSRGLSAEAAALICSCLSLTPAQRPQSVSAVLSALDAATRPSAAVPSVPRPQQSKRPDTVVESDEPSAPAADPRSARADSLRPFVVEEEVDDLITGVPGKPLALAVGTLCLLAVGGVIALSDWSSTVDTNEVMVPGEEVSAGSGMLEDAAMVVESDPEDVGYRPELDTTSEPSPLSVQQSDPTIPDASSLGPEEQDTTVVAAQTADVEDARTSRFERPSPRGAAASPDDPTAGREENEQQAVPQPLTPQDRASDMVSRARRLSVDRNFLEAIRLLEEALTLTPENAQIYLLLFNNYQRVGDNAMAARSIRRYLELVPGDSRRPEFEEWLLVNAP